ncbi:hypothetical protein ONZ43_g661 [Nemania bipapillata]|uniref:Uncharacterized protein n=1 Tax=Nemania bipapillata TaxID=110536 RepID=A0ACC2J780_9PEZI|nr:hypothetical protein ONZ43_g661 [Nemania bipapillata]
MNPTTYLPVGGGPTPFSNGTRRRGVFDTDPDQTLVLLVDVKTDGAKALAQVQAQLEPLRAGNWLSYVEDGIVYERQITVVGTGRAPFDMITQNETYRDIFFDAPLNELYEDPDIPYVDNDDGPFTYNITNSFYASVNFKRAIGPVWSGISDKQLRLIRGQIKGAHRRGLKVRYWNTPAWPVTVRNKIWHTLVAEGADILNVDDLKAATRRRCMSIKTALVTGATGLLGRQVVKAFERADWSVTGTGHSRADGVAVLKVDLAQRNEVGAALDKVKPNVVVHCAANRFPDKCDKDPEGTRALNVTATESLASLCAARDILLIYISTDYVFPGKPGDAPYAADAKPQPTNLYGQTKLDGEYAILGAFEKANKIGLGVVLRVPVLYGDAEMPAESAINVLMDTVWKAQEPEAMIKMDHWALRYPTNTEDVGRVCHDVAEKYLNTQDRTTLPQILQFSSEDKFTKYEICQAFSEIMGLPITTIEPNSEGNDPNAAVQRPYDCHLSTEALKQIGIDVSTQDFTAWWRWHVRAFRK